MFLSNTLNFKFTRKFVLTNDGKSSSLLYPLTAHTPSPSHPLPTVVRYNARDVNIGGG